MNDMIILHSCTIFSPFCWNKHTKEYTLRLCYGNAPGIDQFIFGQSLQSNGEWITLSDKRMAKDHDLMYLLLEDFALSQGLAEEVRNGSVKVSS